MTISLKLRYFNKMNQKGGDVMFGTRITQIFGIKYPILQGAMGYLSRGELVSAVSNAGALGSLATAGIQTQGELREEIRKIKTLTDNPFSVNVSFLPGARPISLEDTIDVVVSERVPVVDTIAMGKVPQDVLKALKDNGIKIIHKCTKIRHAQAAEEQGVDAVALLGFGANGHPGLDEISHFVQIPRAVEVLEIPVIMAGAIASAKGFIAALALGAEGVLMGTRFLTTKECPIHPKIRERLLQAQETDTVLVDVAHGFPARALKNKHPLEILELEKRGTPFEEILQLRSGQRTAKAWREGYIDDASLPCGQVIGIIHQILTVEEVIKGIIDE